jgi:hypothetical protein
MRLAKTVERRLDAVKRLAERIVLTLTISHVLYSSQYAARPGIDTAPEHSWKQAVETA